MESLIMFVSGHIWEWIFAAVMAALAAAYRGIDRRLKSEQQKNEAISAGVQALLRENLVDNFNKYTEKGYCPIYAKESIKKVYAAYHGLGGNDVATELYKKLLDMQENDPNG